MDNRNFNPRTVTDDAGVVILTDADVPLTVITDVADENDTIISEE